MVTYTALLLALAALGVSSWALVLAAYPRIDHASTKIVRELEFEVTNQRDLTEQLAKTVKRMAARHYMRAKRDEEREASGLDDPADPMARRPHESGEAWKARIGSLFLNRRPM